jgi:pyruvate ferredoxin oxidoreductase beta subunit/2-oxoisovalerate ferredoxin oxidoreductase beta subunit
MKNFSIAESEHMTSGHLACQGCGATQAMRFALKALGEKTVIVMPACCWSVINGPFPHTSVQVPVFHTAFETAASCASGVKAGLDMRGDTDTTVMAWAGDGGTFDIGFQALSGAAERNEDIIYACYDNEAYMNTGIQRSSATPAGAWTTTTPHPHPKSHPKKKILEILAAHGIPYLATASVAYPDDLAEKLKKAREIRGMKFLHIFAPCPTGWKSSPGVTVELARLAVQTRLFPLVEVWDGRYYKLNKDIPQMPVAEYLNQQGRFGRLTDEEIKTIESAIDEKWEDLLRKETLGGPPPGNA